MEHPIKMDDLGGHPYFWKHPYIYIYIYLHHKLDLFHFQAGGAPIGLPEEIGVEPREGQLAAHEELPIGLTG